MEIVGKLSVGGLPIDVYLSPDGYVFFVANQGRHGVSVVDWLDTETGQLVKAIRVGSQPHGLTYFPAPGDHSTGHNGVYR